MLKQTEKVVSTHEVKGGIWLIFGDQGTVIRMGLDTHGVPKFCRITDLSLDY